MKKFFLFILICFVFQQSAFALVVEDGTNLKVSVYAEKNKFGLEDSNKNKITKPIYRKLVVVGENAWIAQKGSRFGLINKEGEYLVKPKYSHADRIKRKYAKLGNDKDYGLYDEFGNVILKAEYSSIEPLFGEKLLVHKDYKYGLMNEKGEVLLPNVFDEMYMPTPTALRFKYKGQWIEITEYTMEDGLKLSDESEVVEINNKKFKITKIMVNTGVYSGYSVVSATNYLLKLFSSISPAYEKTIDELMYSQGADAVGILMNTKWIVTFPVIYAKKYFDILIAPNNGPLAGVKEDLKNQIK